MSLSVDTSAIRREVESRIHDVRVREDWLTPSGRPRSSRQYETTISNRFLGKSRVIRGKTFSEVGQKAREQIQKWVEEAIKTRASAAKQDAKERSQDTFDALVEAGAERLEALRSILAMTLDFDDRLDWESLIDHATFNEPRFGEAEPQRPRDPPAPEPRPRTLWDKIIGSCERRRLAEHEAALEAHRADCAARGARREAAFAAWSTRRAAAEQAWEQRRSKPAKAVS